MNTAPFQNIPEVVHTYLAQVKQFIQETEQLGLVERVTGPALYNCEKNWSVLFNVYPSHKDKVDEVFERLVQIARRIATRLAGENGEIISAKVGKGEISDQGQTYFEITRGHIFECYQYGTECFAYIRVFQEKKISGGESWISFDMDFMEKSAWFNEKLTI